MTDLNLEINLEELLVFVTSRYSLEELSTMCFQLDIEFDTFAGTDLRSKSRELIKYLQRNDRLFDLLLRLRNDRPIAFQQSSFSMLVTQDVDRKTIIPGSSLESLPPVSKRIISREKEIEAISQILEDVRTTIIHIGGLQGIGKTFLASSLYYSLQRTGEYYPIWLDCKRKSITLEALLDFLATKANNREIDEVVADPLEGIPERINQIVRHFMVG